MEMIRSWKPAVLAASMWPDSCRATLTKTNTKNHSHHGQPEFHVGMPGRCAYMSNHAIARKAAIHSGSWPTRCAVDRGLEFQKSVAGLPGAAALAGAASQIERDGCPSS